MPSLAQRFVAGSNNIYVSTPEQRAFFIGMPRSVKEVENLSRELLAAHTATFHELQRGFSENAMLLNEISCQLSSLESAVNKGFQELSDAVFHLEDTLCAELVEVKWVLGQMDRKLGQLVHLVKFPHETEARELVEDGVKALATGHLDDAEYCLAKAVETKRTSFQGNMNLAFVFLHKEDPDRAIAHFRKAVDYAPTTEKDGAKIFALERLARAYFAASSFVAARDVIEQALALRTRHGERSLHSEYQYATYCAQANGAVTAISTVISLCQVKSSFFTMAATDSDFEPIRRELLLELASLARATYDRGVQELSEAQVKFRTVLREINEAENRWELDAVRTGLAAAHDWLNARTYENSVQARRVVEVALGMTDELRASIEARRLASEAGRAHSEATNRVAEARLKLDQREEELAAAISRTDRFDGRAWARVGRNVGAVVGFVVFFAANLNSGGLYALVNGILGGLMAAILLAIVCRIAGAITQAQASAHGRSLREERSHISKSPLAAVLSKAQHDADSAAARLATAEDHVAAIGKRQWKRVAAIRELIAASRRRVLTSQDPSA